KRRQGPGGLEAPKPRLLVPIRARLAGHQAPLEPSDDGARGGGGGGDVGDMRRRLGWVTRATLARSPRRTRTNRLAPLESAGSAVVSALRFSGKRSRSRWCRLSWRLRQHS